jgi:hypothetical protein
VKFWERVRLNFLFRVLSIPARKQQNDRMKFRDSLTGLDKSYYSALDDLLYDEWDPLGVNDSAPRDEYSSYAYPLYHLSRTGFSEVEIVGYLNQVSLKWFGQEPNLELNSCIAKRVLEIWKDHFEESTESL